MISATRMLCQKYTDLTDAEISYLESYGALLPALANAEQADVFIDCRTVSGRPLCQLTVWDNGVGFQADRPRPGGAGLELASTIVREKLTGEWSVESGPGGTRISFDFLEQ